ncbi:hypothetical protein M0805_009078 [Coniferiporia weirii]|nr:hypothetical protein M0805_009078 [Coniferiporia weirii]
MLSKVQYKTLPILLRSHKLSIFLDAPPGKTVAELKQDALSALTSRVVNAGNEVDVPEVCGVADFELCREIKERRVPTGKFETLDGAALVKDVASAYEVLVVRFRGESGRLMPAEYTLPPISADDDDEPEPEPSSSKGKRKAFPQ